MVNFRNKLRQFLSFTKCIGLIAFCSSFIAPVYAVPIYDHTPYAVLFSGGGNQDSNHTRYYDQTLRMWEIATTTLGIGVDNVYVLFGDGTDTTDDQCTSTDFYGNCTGHTNSDWSMIEAGGGNIVPGTHNNLQNTLASLNIQMDYSDTFYFWSFNHGYNPDWYPGVPEDQVGDDVELVAWNSAGIRDDELAAWVDPFDVKAEIYAFGQCFAGGMVDDLNVTAWDETRRFAAWAASACEPSYGYGWIDAWGDGIESGITSTTLLGQYAWAHDPYGPGGYDLEHPGYAGRDFYGIPVPEPSTPFLFAIGGLALLASRLKSHSQSQNLQ